jgi:hypothetical protein
MKNASEKALGKTPKKQLENKKYNKAYKTFLSNIGTGEVLDRKAVLK